MPSASALPTFSWPGTISLVSAPAIWSVTSELPWLISAAAVAYAEKAFVKSSRRAPRKLGARIGPPTWRQNDHDEPPRLADASYHSWRTPSREGRKTISISGIWKYM